MQFDPNSYDTSLTLEDRIDVSIVSQKPLDEETEKELQQFTWKIESLSQSKIDISLDFLFPHSVSVDRDNPSSVWIKAKFSDFEPGWVDDLVIAAIELPKQEKPLVEEEADKLQRATDLAASAGDSLVAVILFNILTSGSMS